MGVRGEERSAAKEFELSLPRKDFAMRRWMLSFVAVALLVPAAIADDSSDSTPRPTFPLIKKKKAAPQQKVIRFIVMEEAQPMPAGPSPAPAIASPAPAPVPGIMVAPLTPIDTGCDDGSQVVRPKGLFHKSNRHSENCAGCGGFCYDMWFGFSSCASFFMEGKYRPSYPDNCPECSHGYCKKHKK